MCKFRFLALSLTLSLTVGAVDWPQFRFGANRGAASPEVLAGTLHLQWTREFAAPSPAFPGEVRLRYDATYEPVVMGGTIFVPESMNAEGHRPDRTLTPRCRKPSFQPMIYAHTHQAFYFIGWHPSGSRRLIRAR